VILVDTSIWIDHFRRALPSLQDALATGVVGTHAFVVGELALGQLRHREQTLRWLARLPHVTVATQADVMHVVEQHALAGTGLGWVDAHLLCAARLAGWRLWSGDRAVARAASRLGVH
jgi:predicted nucleic acid-binding protein